MIFFSEIPPRTLLSQFLHCSALFFQPSLEGWTILLFFENDTNSFLFCPSFTFSLIKSHLFLKSSLFFLFTLLLFCFLFTLFFLLQLFQLFLCKLRGRFGSHLDQSVILMLILIQTYKQLIFIQSFVFKRLLFYFLRFMSN